MPLEEVDLVNGLIILLPGFVFIKSYDYLVGRIPFRDNFEFGIWSSFISVILYIISSSINSYFNLNSPNIVLFGTFILLLVILLISEKLSIFSKLRNYFSIGENPKHIPKNSVWDIVIPGYREYVIINTSDRTKYCGQILLFTEELGKNGEQNREIFLHNPIKLNSDAELEEYENNLKGVLLLENDIQRIEFLSIISDQENIK